MVKSILATAASCALLAAVDASRYVAKIEDTVTSNSIDLFAVEFELDGDAPVVLSSKGTFEISLPVPTAKDTKWENPTCALVFEDEKYSVPTTTSISMVENVPVIKGSFAVKNDVVPSGAYDFDIVCLIKTPDMVANPSVSNASAVITFDNGVTSYPKSENDFRLKIEKEGNPIASSAVVSASGSKTDFGKGFKTVLKDTAAGLKTISIKVSNMDFYGTDKVCKVSTNGKSYDLPAIINTYNYEASFILPDDATTGKETKIECPGLTLVNTISGVPAIARISSLVGTTTYKITAPITLENSAISFGSAAAVVAVAASAFAYFF